MDKVQTGAELRSTIRTLLQGITGFITTADVAKRVGASVATTFRELTALEGEGVVSRRFGSAVANVRWYSIGEAAR